MSCIYKTALICRYVALICANESKQYGPLSTMLKTAKKYDLLDMIKKLLETGECVPRKEWKKIVELRVSYRELTLWRVRAKLFSSLRVCKDMSFIKMSCWWIYVQQFPYEMKKV